MGVVVSVTELVGVMVFYDTGCSLVCAVRVLAVCKDVVQICSILVIGAGMFVKHCQLIQPVLGHLQPPCGLQEEFDSADVG